MPLYRSKIQEIYKLVGITVIVGLSLIFDSDFLAFLAGTFISISIILYLKLVLKPNRLRTSEVARHENINIYRQLYKRETAEFACQTEKEAFKNRSVKKTNNNSSAFNSTIPAWKVVDVAEVKSIDSNSTIFNIKLRKIVDGAVEPTIEDEKNKLIYNSSVGDSLKHFGGEVGTFLKLKDKHFFSTISNRSEAAVKASDNYVKMCAGDITRHAINNKPTDNFTLKNMPSSPKSELLGKDHNAYGDSTMLLEKDDNSTTLHSPKIFTNVVPNRHIKRKKIEKMVDSVKSNCSYRNLCHENKKCISKNVGSCPESKQNITKKIQKFFRKFVVI